MSISLLCSTMTRASHNTPNAHHEQQYLCTHVPFVKLTELAPILTKKILSSLQILNIFDKSLILLIQFFAKYSLLQQSISLTTVHASACSRTTKYTIILNDWNTTFKKSPFLLCAIYLT